MPWEVLGSNLARNSDFQLHAGSDDDCRSAAATSGAVTHQEVEAILAARRQRGDFFPVELFADPAWDMLLQLYALQLKQRRVSVSKLCLCGGVPQTTALRWIAKLEAEGLVHRENDPLDARRWWIDLSDAGTEAMRSYFSGVRARSVV